MSATLSNESSTKFLLASQPLRRRLVIICGTLGILILAATIFSAAHGPANILYADVARLILRGLGFHTGMELSSGDFSIVNNVRVPRVLVGLLVGAALSCSGATLQGTRVRPGQ